MDPATVAAFGAILAFLRDAGLLGWAIVLGWALYTGRAYLKPTVDEIRAAAARELAVERERRAEALRQRDEWKRLAEGSGAKLDATTKAVNVLGDAVGVLAKSVDGLRDDLKPGAP